MSALPEPGAAAKRMTGSSRAPLGILNLRPFGAEYDPWPIVTNGMRSAGSSLPTKAGLVVLIAVTIFVTAVRPLTRPTGHLYARFGLSRMSLLTEAADESGTPLPEPAVTHTHVVAPLLLVGALLLVLKARRAEFRSVPFRRLKLPARSPDRSISSH